jgi:ATP-dependent DNA helicase RecG
MSKDRAIKLIEQQEGIHLEFKKAENSLPANLFETICAMLNREGGDIFLGVDKNNHINGVNDVALHQMMADIASLSNNPNKLDPPFILFPLHYIIENKNIIHIQVPASSQLHKTAKEVFDRSSDGDFKIKHPHQIAALYNHKRNYYTEGIIFPALSFEDFKQELFPKVRQLIRSNNPNHPWLALGDEKMLEIAGLWRKDYNSREEGYTLAAALLFGKDEVIQQILPHYKIDALLRVENLDRYDDRVYIQTNLIEAYEQLMAFVDKHLPDKFYMEGAQRVSLRAKIFREIVANLIVHREYTNAYPCSFVILRDRLISVNANNPHGEGPIDPHNFAPFPKNPTIAKFFIQLGRVDELGSGVLNVHRLIKEYGGKGNVLFTEGNPFTLEIPLPNIKVAGKEVSLDEALETLLKTISSNPGIKSKDLSLKLDNRPIKSLERQIKILVDKKLIERRGSKKTGGYYSVDILED